MAERKGEDNTQSRPPRLPWLSLILALAVVVSAIGVTYSAHRSRELFRTLEQARRDQNEIQIEWRQLLLERSTLSSHARVEQIAGEQLQMVPLPEGDAHVLTVTR